MRIALIADIHANVTALEAVLRDIRRRGVDRIISLGDQVNLGACPRETLALLREAGAVCLHGNHERYIRSAMDGDPAYAGANFSSLRFNAAMLTKEEISFPDVIKVGCVTLCHAMPGDDRFPVNDPSKAMPVLEKMDPEEPLHIVCGHGHNPISYRCPKLTLDDIGSTGCMDDGVPGVTLYTLMDLSGEGFSLHPVYLPYDTSPIKGQFIHTGMAEFCPIMARIACMQMLENREIIVDFVSRAIRLSAQKGEKHMALSTWEEADRLYRWPDGLTTAEFWKT